jgi:hypothetical protein
MSKSSKKTFLFKSTDSNKAPHLCRSALRPVKRCAMNDNGHVATQIGAKDFEGINEKPEILGERSRSGERFHIRFDRFAWARCAQEKRRFT